MQNKHRGFGLYLIFLIVMVLGFVVYFSINPTDMFHGSANNDPNMPWNEEGRLVAQNGTINTPLQSQPAIDQMMNFKLSLKENNGDRGTVMMRIDADGRLSGTWLGEYRPSPKITRTVMSSKIEGNIDSSKVFLDGSGQDDSQLFVIGKGKFMILEFNDDDSTTQRKLGTIYLTGWLSTDYVLTGKVTLTSDKKDCEVYNFKNSRIENLFAF